jgi:hypothetical protein
VEKIKRDTPPIARESDVIVLILSAYSDEVKSDDTAKHQALAKVKRAALQKKESDVIALILSAYSDEIEGGDIEKVCSSSKTPTLWVGQSGTDMIYRSSASRVLSMLYALSRSPYW